MDFGKTAFIGYSAKSIVRRTNMTNEFNPGLKPKKKFFVFSFVLVMKFFINHQIVSIPKLGEN